MGGLSSSSEEPSAEEMLRIRRRISAPDNEAPVAVAVSTVLARSPDAAVLLTSAVAYSTGTEFQLSIRTRPNGDRRTTPLFQLLHGHGLEEADPNQAFLLGVQFADGRRAMTGSRHGMPPRNDQSGEDEVVLAIGSSSGSDNTYDLNLWMSPLPPAGPVTLVCRWPELDINETTLTLDGAAIAAAGHAATELWPPEIAEPAPEPPAPGLPDGGWFAGQN